MHKKGGYEAHMTFDREHARIVEEYASNAGFVFSVITGCPLLGQGTYCYLTLYNKDDPDFLVQKMRLASGLLEEVGVSTLRAKVEHIVYDTKTGVNEVA